MSVENFGDTPETFDLDAWIESGTRPRRTVKVYRDWSLMGELADLEQKIAAADAEEDPSMGDVSAGELREEYDRVLERLAESAISVTLQALTGDEVATITAGVPEVEQEFTDQQGKEQKRLKPDRVAIGDALVAAAAVSPVMTRDQVKRMRERLGDGPTMVLYTTVGELRNAGRELPTAPFSAASSDDSPE